MAIANLQAQMTNLTSQLSQYIERTTIQSTPTFDVSYTQGYEADQHPQRNWESYHDHNQSMNNLFSNTYNSDWSDHSNTMWWEPQPVQHEGYWQPYNEFYSSPAQPPQTHIQYTQPNSGSSIDYDKFFDEINSLAQGSQNQAKRAQQGEYWQPYEEFYTTPMHPPQPPPQQFQSNSGMSLDSDHILQLLSSLTQDLQNQDKKLGELNNQMGEIVEFMGQIQEQSELSNSTIVNPRGDFEIAEAITLGSGIEVRVELNMSKHSLEVNEELMLEEEEEEQPLPQPPKAPPPSNSGNVIPHSLLSNPIPPNVSFSRMFMISKEEESAKDILEAIPKMQSNIPILGTPNQVPDYVEVFKEPCSPRRRSQEKEVARECQEFSKEDIFETTKPKEVEIDDTRQITPIIVNLAKFKVPETFKEVVFILEFVTERKSKSSTPISITFYTYILLMIQAPTLESTPLPDHFKYHLPFKDQFHVVGPREV
ncbi:hypothetical protein PS1_020608 [Malus domestica]